jgi:hypothetical protein
LLPDNLPTFSRFQEVDAMRCEFKKRRLFNERNAVRLVATLFGALVFGAMLPERAAAQVGVAEAILPEAVSSLAGQGLVVDGGGYPFRASTPGESFARGRAAVIQAQGEANRLNSQAAINFQEARARAGDSTRAGLENYFAIRSEARAYRQAERGPRPTPEELQRRAQAAKPDPLSPSEFDALTGEFNWPILLRDDTFDTSRQRIEQILGRRAIETSPLRKATGLETDEYLEALRLTDEMKDQLRDRIRSLPPQDYMAAKRFLGSVEYEIRNPTRSGLSLASNIVTDGQR